MDDWESAASRVAAAGGFDTLLAAPGKRRAMVDTETVFQIVISIFSVLGFIAGMVFVSQAYSTNGDISPDGGMALVGAMVAFILVMAAVGLWMSQQDFDDEDDGDASGA